MLPSNFHELMISPEIFKVNLYFENRPHEVRKNYCFSNPLFNAIFVNLFKIWVTTGHGELKIKSEVYKGKTRVFLEACPTHLFYISAEQLTEIKKVDARIIEEAIQRINSRDLSA